MGVEVVLDAIVEQVPAPKPAIPTKRALIFDSYYDDYRGVILYLVRFDGQIKSPTLFTWLVQAAMVWRLR